MNASFEYGDPPPRGAVEVNAGYCFAHDYFRRWRGRSERELVNRMQKYDLCVTDRCPTKGCCSFRVSEVANTPVERPLQLSGGLEVDNGGMKLSS
jgi:hypothetical protein